MQIKPETGKNFCNNDSKIQPTFNMMFLAPLEIITIDYMHGMNFYPISPEHVKECITVNIDTLPINASITHTLLILWSESFVYVIHEQ